MNTTMTAEELTSLRAWLLQAYQDAALSHAAWQAADRDLMIRISQLDRV
jgi:hypothetical protein